MTKKLGILYHLARADFLERVRRYSFLMTLAATVYLGFAMGRGDLYLQLGGYRGVMNAPWVGGMMVAATIIMVSFFGFYVVKNSIERDMQTGVGQILAATPLSRSAYLLGKWLSNWAVLSVIVAVMVLAALAIQVSIRGLGELDFHALVLPFIVLAAPATAMVAAVALFFEAVPWLRGGFGNVVYFFLWMSTLALAFIIGARELDWSGMTILQQSMASALRAVHPEYTAGFSFTGKPLPPGGLQTFTWPGLEWTAEIIAGRLAWLAGAAGLALAGTPLFHRFDPSRLRTPAKPTADQLREREEPVLFPGEAALKRAGLSPLPSYAPRLVFMRVLGAEMRLLLRGQPWWWYAGSAILILGGLIAPPDVARQGWLPAAWIWPLLIWSGLGTREVRQRTEELVFSSPHPLLRQLGGTWLAALVVTALIGSGVAIKLAGAGAWPALGAWMAGALFIPSLALALGVWSRSTRLFEIAYLLLWYLGPLHPREIPMLDFLGATDQSVSAGVPGIVALVTAALVLFALLGRWRQLSFAR